MRSSGYVIQAKLLTSWGVEHKRTDNCKLFIEIQECFFLSGSTFCLIHCDVTKIIITVLIKCMHIEQDTVHASRIRYRSSRTRYRACISNTIPFSSNTIPVSSNTAIVYCKLGCRLVRLAAKVERHHWKVISTLYKHISYINWHQTFFYYKKKNNYLCEAWKISVWKHKTNFGTVLIWYSGDAVNFLWPLRTIVLNLSQSSTGWVHLFELHMQVAAQDKYLRFYWSLTAHALMSWSDTS